MPRMMFAVFGLALTAAAAFAQTPVQPSPLDRAFQEAALQDFECDDCPNGCAHAKSLRARFAQGENPDGSPVSILAAPPADYANVDLLHNNLNIEVNPSTGFLGGSNTMTFRSVVDSLTQVRVRLQNIFNVTSVRVGGAPVGASQLDDRHITVFLDRAYNVNEVFDVSVDYSGFPQNNGFDAILFTTQGGAPIASTLSETDFAYTWWPTKDDNRDKATAYLRFTVPSTMSVASNGSMMIVTDAAPGKKTWYWKTNYPIATYLVSFAITNYNRFSGSYNWGGGVMPLEFFIYPGSDTSSNRNAWLQTAQMLATYRPIFGLYPFINEKYGIYQFPFGGGMEHQTMTGQGTFSESVTAHELGHQWWGDMVTCASWNDIWLNEGFATYAEALWLERKPGALGEPSLHSAMASRRPSAVNSSVYIYEPLNNSDINRIFSTSFSYRKPAWVLHMLRHVVGESTFFDILAAYRAAFEFKSATTDDFIAVAETVYGQDLNWFFDPWIYNIGAPAYQRASRTITVNGQTYVELMIRQAQSASYPIFTMPLDVELFIGGVSSTRTVWNNAAQQWYLLPVSAAPTTVTLDPKPWVLATSNTTTAFSEGPPKVIATSPAPGIELPTNFAGPISVTFHKNVTTTAANYSLTREGGGAPLFSFTYNSATRTTTLSPASPLPGGQYTLTILDAVVDPLSGRALDGEVSDPTSASSFPSGNGLPGGAAVIRFSVSSPPPAPCFGDADGNQQVDFADITSVLADWGASYVPGAVPAPGDADHDGAVNFADITAVLAHFELPCQ
ncbi:MAG: Ig-like domain-containing protein [Phycisphaerae bacterium]|nr:Ig-like domain-containing protein [Phycisphaerae bacterium]